MREYAVTEIFYSLQGEGYYTGTPAIFIRFASCNLRCPFCDTDYNRGSRYSVAAILDKCRKVVPPIAKPRLVVLTGGEPTLQVDADLCDALHEEYPVIAMETNGSNPIPEGVDFVTCSPKCDFVREYQTIQTADEVKVVFDGQTGHSPRKWEQRIEAAHYYIQPCDTGDTEKNKTIIEQAVAWCLAHPRWRLSLQTQKILNVR